MAQQAPSGSSQTLVGLATFGLGGVLLLLLDLRAVGRLVRDPGALPGLLLAALGVLAYAACYYRSMDLVGVAVGNALALGSGPVFAALLELVVERRPMRASWLLASAVSVLGIALLASASAGESDRPVLGVVLGLAAGLGYATYSWSAERAINRGRPSRAVVAGTFATASLVLVPVVLLSGPGPLLGTGRGLVVVGYLALVPMAGAYLLFGYGLRRLPASTATTLALAEPVVASGLAVIVLREQIGPFGATGIALVVVGVLLVARSERAPGERAPGERAPSARARPRDR